jgi:hypothetical protein
MQVLIAVLSFIDIVALTFLNGYWVRAACLPCILPLLCWLGTWTLLLVTD